VILALFIVSMLGPWMFDLINVPAEYECDKPFVRLEGDFCGLPLSGIKFFTWFAGGFFQIIVGLMTGTFTGRSRELIVGFSILPLIPFFTTLPLIWKKETPRLRTINLVTWILALIPTVFIFLETQRSGQVLRLWGPLLYILVAVGALTVEILIQRGKVKEANGA